MKTIAISIFLCCLTNFLFASITITISKTDITCNGLNNGSITVTASGGTAPYTYSINGTSYQSSNSFTGLTPGSYTVYVMDNTTPTPQTNTTNFTISEPTPLSVQGGATPICEGVEFDPIAFGGTPPYMYRLNGNQYVSFPGPLALPGVTTGLIEVKDSRGCMASNTSSAVPFPSIRLNPAAHSENVSSPGASDGAIKGLYYYTPGWGAGYVATIAYNTATPSSNISATRANDGTLEFLNLPVGNYVVSQSYTTPFQGNPDCGAYSAGFTISNPTNGVYVFQGGNLLVSGYFCMGSSGPCVQAKVIQSTSPSATGGTVTIPHGVSNIIVVSVLITSSAGNDILPGSFISGTKYSVYTNATNVVIQTVSGDDNLILNRPVKIWIVYQQ